MMRYLTATASLLVLAVCATSVRAQYGAQQSTRQALQRQLMRGAGPGPPTEAWKAQGTIHSFNARQLNVVTDDQQAWRVALGPQTLVTVKGEGGPEMLRARSAVRFIAMVTPRGNVTEPVKEVTMFTPQGELQPGIKPAPEEEPEARGRRGSRQSAESDPDEDSFPEEDATRRGGRRTADAATTEREEADSDKPARMEVVGVLMSFRRGRFMVTAGDEKVRGEFAEDLKVSADFSSLEVARRGDEVNVQGLTWPTPPGAPPAGQAIAQKVDVTLAPPEKEKEKKNSRSRANDESTDDRDRDARGSSDQRPESDRD